MLAGRHRLSMQQVPALLLPWVTNTSTLFFFDVFSSYRASFQIKLYWQLTTDRTVHGGRTDTQWERSGCGLIIRVSHCEHINSDLWCYAAIGSWFIKINNRCGQFSRWVPLLKKMARWHNERTPVSIHNKNKNKRKLTEKWWWRVQWKDSF